MNEASNTSSIVTTDDNGNINSHPNNTTNNNEVDQINNTNTNNNPPSGPKGIRLRVFEQVVSRILNHSGPLFPKQEEEAWPFRMYSAFPTSFTPTRHPWSIELDSILKHLAGSNSSSSSRSKKEGQIQSMIDCVLCILFQSSQVVHPLDNHLTIVDFCGGSGHVAIPLALLLGTVPLPNTITSTSLPPRVIVVDLKQESLQLLQKRAQEAVPQQSCKPQNLPKHSYLQSTAISNLFLFHGDIMAYSQTITNTNFHIGMALHACGEATDLALRLCLQQKAAFILAPCCIGKLSTHTQNPYIFHATNQNLPTVTYPQSHYYTCQLGMTQDEFNAIAKAADYSNEKMTSQEANAIRRIAKTCVEWDRLCYAKETVPNYTVVLTKMNPITSSPKNDILIGWIEHPIREESEKIILSNTTSTILTASAGKQDIVWAMQHLNLPSYGSSSSSSSRMEWSYEEETHITKQIESFCRCNTQLEYNFPPGQGSRIRKLIHHIAELHGLSHKSLGKQNSKRYVVITKK